MKHNVFILSCIFCAALYQWSCQPETVTPSDDKIDFRDPGNGNGQGQGNGNGNGNGNNGGGEETLYAVTIAGSTITCDTVGTQVESSNGKFTNLTFELCDPPLLSGIDLLNSCYEPTYSAVFFEIRQFNKKKSPEKVALHFWFLDPAVGGSGDFDYLVFSMFGDIDGTALLPEEDVDVVDITFKRWQLKPSSGVDAPEACLQEEVIDFEEGKEPEMTISYATGCPS